MCWGRGLWVFSFYGIMVRVQSWEKIAGSQSFLVNSISVFLIQPYKCYMFYVPFIDLCCWEKKKESKDNSGKNGMKLHFQIAAFLLHASDKISHRNCSLILGLLLLIPFLDLFR